MHAAWWTQRREADPDDGRATRLTLSDPGRALLDRLRREATAELQAEIAERQLGRARARPSGVEAEAAPVQQP